MEEQTFLQEGNVTVTRSRIVIANQTYPVANITAIRTDTVLPNLMLPFLMGVFGVILLLASITQSGATFLLGAVLIAAAVFAWWQAKTTHKIFFGTAGGEQSVLESEDGDYVERVARAIDEALIEGR